MGSFSGVINIKHNPILLMERYTAVVPKRDISPCSFLTFTKMNYSNRAEGNYYRLSFELHAPIDYLKLFFYGGLMRHVTVDSPQGKVLWEGFIYEMSMNLPKAVKRITVQSIINKSWVRYQLIGSGSVSRTAIINNTVSQNRYGIREGIFSSGETNSATEALQLGNRFLEYNRIPKVMTDELSISTSTQAARESVIKVVCYGYYETLKWQMYNQTVNTGVQSASQEITDVVTAKVQFYKTLKTGANSTPTPRVYDMDRSAESIMKSIATMGDAYYRRWLIRYLPNLVLSFQEAAPPDYPPV